MSVEIYFLLQSKSHYSRKPSEADQHQQAMQAMENGFRHIVLPSGTDENTRMDSSQEPPIVQLFDEHDDEEEDPAPETIDVDDENLILDAESALAAAEPELEQDVLALIHDTVDDGTFVCCIESHSLCLPSISLSECTVGGRRFR